MKVLWLCPYPLQRLGDKLLTNRPVQTHSASWIVNLSNELCAQKEIDFHILTYSAQVIRDQEIVYNNITFHILKYTFPFTNKGYPDYFPVHVIFRYQLLRKRARKIIKAINPDIVHAYGTEGPFSIIAQKSGYPYMISMQGIMKEYYRANPNLKRFLQKRIEYHNVKNSKYFDCRTSIDTNYVNSVNKNAYIFQIPRALNPAFYRSRWEDNDYPSIVFTGYIIPRKGMEILINAIGEIEMLYPDLRVYVIGSGIKEYILNLKQTISGKRLDRYFKWEGKKSAGEIAQYLKNSTLFVLPSLMDNSPNSLAEAMAVGTPCIASNVGGVPSMVSDNQDGLLFANGNYVELSNKIKLLLQNRKLRIKLSENARKRAGERNAPEKVMHKVLDAYNLILEKNKV